MDETSDSPRAATVNVGPESGEVSHKAASTPEVDQATDPHKARLSRAHCRCGVYEYVHLEGRGCGNFRKASRLRVWRQHHEVWQHIAAPIWLRLPEKRRWTIVRWLDKSRRRCWSSLVSDALAYREDDPCDVHVPRLRGERAPSCASVCDWMHPDHAGSHECACYCGKFQFIAPDGAKDRTSDV